MILIIHTELTVSGMKYPFKLALASLQGYEQMECKDVRWVLFNVVCFLRRPLDYYTMELSEHTEGLSDL